MRVQGADPLVTLPRPKSRPQPQAGQSLIALCAEGTVTSRKAGVRGIPLVTLADPRLFTFSLFLY